MSRHTKEPWHVEESDICAEVNGFQTVIADCFNHQSIGRHDADANAERIVACVNACKGFDTELLELSASGTAPSLHEIFREHADLWKQRDQLRGALEIARARIQQDRSDLFDCQANPITGTVTDQPGIDALAEYDEVLAKIDAAIEAAP